jgi:hypothetical protein
MRERIKSNSQAPLNQQGESMRDAVVREVLTSTHDRRQPAEVDTPLKNLATYVEVVHHTGYSDSLIACVYFQKRNWFFIDSSLDLGYTLTSMAAQITDWKSTAFDPNSLLRVCSLVAQHHKPQSKVMFFKLKFKKKRISSYSSSPPLGSPPARGEIPPRSAGPVQRESRDDCPTTTGVNELSPLAQQGPRWPNYAKLYCIDFIRNAKWNAPRKDPGPIHHP